jgi:hypothetical protein
MLSCELGSVHVYCLRASYAGELDLEPAVVEKGQSEYLLSALVVQELGLPEPVGSGEEWTLSPRQELLAHLVGEVDETRV